MLLTVDIGTSSFKSALWDFDGNRLAFAALPLSMTEGIAAHGAECCEADCGQWLRAFAGCCTALEAQCAAPLSRVEAVAISGNGPSLVPVFSAPEYSGGTVRVDAAPARLWLDRRAAEAAAEVSACVGDFVDASFFLPKALDIKNNEPELYARSRFFLGCPEFLAFALTGQARTVFPSEGFDRWFWDAETLKQLNLAPEKFPAFVRPGQAFGNLMPAAACFGLRPDIPVVCGGPDFFVAILGTGVAAPGQVCDRAGTSEGLNLCTENRIADPRLMSYGHPVQPFWNLSGIISTTGKAVEWAKGFMGLATYDELFALANTAESGAGGLVFLPCLAGERAPVWNPHARGILRGLSLACGRAEFARAVLEGICCAIRDVLAVMEETGATVRELRVSGMAAENAFLNQLKADITGKEVLVPTQPEAELLGLAIIGSCYLGKHASYAEAAHALARVEKRFQPDEKKASLYNRLFADYRETYRKLYG